MVVVHGRLPTNEYRVKFGMEGMYTCEMCLLNTKSLDHLLRSCFTSQASVGNHYTLFKDELVHECPFSRVDC